MLHIYESFYNTKSIKLFGWENKFLNTIETTYNEELAIGDKALHREKMHDIIAGFFEQFMQFAVFSVYTGMGNTLTLSQMALCSIMLERIRSKI